MTSSILPCVLILLAIGALVYFWRWTRGAPVKNVSCAKCRYVVEFAPKQICPECGTDLLQHGILRPGTGYIHPGRRMILTIILLALPALILATIVGQLSEWIFSPPDSPPRENAQGSQSIIAEHSASGAIHRIKATAHYTIRENLVRYTKLELTATTKNGSTATPLEVSLPKRPFILNWQPSNHRWTGSFEPDSSRNNQSRQILRESDVSPEQVIAWLNDEGMKLEDPAARDEIDSYISYVIENMVAGGRRLPSLERFTKVQSDSSFDFLPKARTAERVTKWTVFTFLWLIFAWLAWRKYRWSVQKRRGDAALWLESIATTDEASPSTHPGA